ncbi:MAG: DeoR/GlpR family DNA-binding transcription regulator [Acetivibrionales bacterium]|jgi:DeoR family fructose operon transcriptional repressor
MFAIERLNKIKEILFREKRVDVFELSEMFSVTEVTIRRDLDKLEQEGFLIKTYGGAVLNEKYLDSPSIASFMERASEEKQMIGKIASAMVEDGDAIFLSPGSTCLEIARNIKQKRVTVVTNDLVTGLELRNSPGVKVIVTGGDLIQSTSTLVGGFTLQALHGIYISKAFIGVKGINFNSGYTVDSYEEVMVVEEVRKKSNDLIIIADYTKFNYTAFARLGDLQMAKKVITNKQVPAEYKKYYFENDIKLYTTFEFE